MPGTVLLLAASPVGRGRLVDAASVLPVLAAVAPGVLSGTETANVVELADPLEPQAVLTRLRAAATAPGPLTVFITGQLQLDRKQHLPHLALARTTPATVRYTGFPWAWVREELRLRAPGTTTLLLDLHADAETWQWLRVHPLDSGRTNAVYGRIAPPPARRGVAVPSYMKAVATILRSGWRPPVEELHQQALGRLGAEGYADVLLSAPGVAVTGNAALGVAVPGVGAPGVGAGVPGGSAPRPPSALKGPRPQTPDGLDFAGLSGKSAAQGEVSELRSQGSAPRGPEDARPSQEGARQDRNSAPPGQEVAWRSQDDDAGRLSRKSAAQGQVSASRSQEGALPSHETARRGQEAAGRSTDDATRSQEAAGRSQYGAPPSPGNAPPSQYGAPSNPHNTPPDPASALPTPDNDPHIAVASAAQAGRHLDADALAAEHEQAAVRAHGRGSEEALHWIEVRADLAMLAGDPVRSCRAWLAVAVARLAVGQAPGTAAVEAAVDRAHHQWGQIHDPAPARELGLTLAELRSRVPGRRAGALDHVRKQLLELQS
ncbi:hypothetical protein OG824_11715 [Streptomyces prunicolor]|uniref:hypothetical protein n=1 Tax=Streptomyces prunicolor TaxID=67348 RepID=UPI002250A9C4|nr:hypothetical protein [Streptomyces prunicolor]MCX5235871.1 hypothetical protein [Streptomyces prunicolor]